MIGERKNDDAYRHPVAGNELFFNEVHKCSCFINEKPLSRVFFLPPITCNYPINSKVHFSYPCHNGSSDLKHAHADTYTHRHLWKNTQTEVEMEETDGLSVCRFHIQNASCGARWTNGVTEKELYIMHTHKHICMKYMYLNACKCIVRWL